MVGSCKRLDWPSLSLAMDEIVKYFSSATKIDRLQMSYLKWSDLVELNNKAITLKKLKSKINARKSIIQKKQLIKLPSIIISKNDFNAFAENQSVPNFITQKKIMAELITYEKISSNNLKGKIVIIPSADPGYDWLFTNMISGLITKFGGANSHMAIRCAELELPAAIGVGEDLYQNLASQKKIFLDCLNEKIDNV